MSTDSPSEPEQQDLPNSQGQPDAQAKEEQPEKRVKSGTSVMHLEWQRERRMKYVIAGGILLLVLAVGGVIVAMNTEPELSSMSDRMDELDRQASQKAAAAAAVEAKPAAEAVADVVEPEAAEVVAPEDTPEPAAEAAAQEELDMPPALIKMVNERMTADSRERFKAQWAGMNEDQRQRYLEQLGL